MVLKGKQKVALLFSLLGPEISANIISKLSLDDANLVRSDILTNIDDVKRPDNIDSFIDELINYNKPKSEPEIRHEVKVQEPEINYNELSEEEILEQIPISDFTKYIQQESLAVQKIAYNILPASRHSEALEYLKRNSEADIGSLEIRETPFTNEIKAKVYADVIKRVRENK
jgi:flagellar motor switch protein FliG